jgi:hypothetical protein
MQGTGLVKLEDIASLFTRKSGGDFSMPITSRFMGDTLRNKLHVRTRKSHGVYVIPISEQPKLKELYIRYGVATDDTAGCDSEDVEIILVDQGDIGDAATVPIID